MDERSRPTPDTGTSISKQTRVPGFLVADSAFEGNLFTRLGDFLTAKPVKLAPNAPTTLGGARVGERFGSSFLENLKHVLTAKAPRHCPADAYFSDEQFESSFLDNLKEFFKGGPRIRVVNSRLLLTDKSWKDTVWENLKFVFTAPRPAPVKGPVPLATTWSRDEFGTRSRLIGLLVHAVFVLLVFVPLGLKVADNVSAAPVMKVNVAIVDVSPYLAKLPPGADKAGGGGGGGERMNTPPSKGRLPKFSLQPLAPPMVTIRNPNPKLAVEPAVAVPPDIRVPQPNIDAYGDPLAKLVTGSGGPGGGGGVGTGCCGGVGSGDGPGVGPGSGGGIGGGVFRPGRGGVGYPECAYCPLPQFSEEARKAKHQGIVLLRVIVQPDGRVTNISVARGLGLGLDEKAIETVTAWRFKPALGPNGKPVPVEVYVEVVFRLL